jgi:hypothetical protein
VNFHASTPTPQVNDEWIRKDNLSRLDQINKVLRGTSFEEFVSPTRTFDDGQIYFTLKKQISSSSRGVLLLDLELMLKENVDPGIIIWCEPIGDKNSLRNLRGIEIIS